MTDAVLALALPGVLPDGWYDLATRVYAEDPRFVPETRSALARDFGPDNSWFERGQAQAFYVPEKARMAVFFDPDKQLDGKATAYFGDFVSSGDPEVEAAIFAAAEAWARARGAAQLHGPMHFTTWHNYRVLVSMEQGGLPFPGEPYDAPSVHQAFERLGYGQIQRYQSQIFEHKVFATVVERFTKGGERAAALGYTAKAEGIPAILDVLPGFYDRGMEIFRDSYAFTAPPKAVWLHGMRNFMQRACPHTTVLARDAQGEVVGYFVNTPDWGQLLVQGESERLRLDELDYQKHLPRLRGPRTVILKTLGVLPSHQQAGVGALLTAELFRHALVHYDRAVGALMREDNRSRTFGSGLYTWDRWYALYGRALT